MKTLPFPVPCLSLKLFKLQFSLCFYDVLLKHAASLLGREMLPPAGPHRFDLSYSFGKDSTIQPFERQQQWFAENVDVFIPCKYSSREK